MKFRAFLIFSFIFVQIALYTGVLAQNSIDIKNNNIVINNITNSSHAIFVNPTQSQKAALSGYMGSKTQIVSSKKQDGGLFTSYIPTFKLNWQKKLIKYIQNQATVVLGAKKTTLATQIITRAP